MFEHGINKEQEVYSARFRSGTFQAAPGPKSELHLQLPGKTHGTPPVEVLKVLLAHADATKNPDDEYRALLINAINQLENPNG